MLTIICGQTGTGKSSLMTKLLLDERKAGHNVFTSYQLFFPKNNEGVTRFHSLEETYGLENGVIGIDDAQTVAGHWTSMPQSFRDKVSAHRHNRLDIITTTQSFTFLHWYLRANAHVRFECQSVFRLPKNEKVFPLLQLIRVVKFTRKPTDIKNINDERTLKWKAHTPFYFFISKLWTKKTFDTFSNLDIEKYVCKLSILKRPGQRNRQLIAKLFNRELITTGKARL